VRHYDHYDEAANLVIAADLPAADEYPVVAAVIEVRQEERSHFNLLN
jgi:hypothetical protein